MTEKPSRITILGGTGTLGRALLRECQARWKDAEITILSRDEHKQAAMKREFQKARFAIGDIRDFHSIAPHISNRDLVFHVAALKHVDIMEESPSECVKTNVLGTENVARAAMAGGVRHLVFSSTDKAVDPINAYGYSKALSEKILFNLNREQSKTRFSVYRWGNVLGSQGSAIPIFAETLMRERKAYITHPDMTRFWLPIEWATCYMALTYPDAYKETAMVPPMMKAARVIDVVDVIAELVGAKRWEPIITKIRPGEKLHEVMYSRHASLHLSSDTADQYTRDELLSMLSPIVAQAKKGLAA